MVALAPVGTAGALGRVHSAANAWPASRSPAAKLISLVIMVLQSGVTFAGRHPRRNGSPYFPAPVKDRYMQPPIVRDYSFDRRVPKYSAGRWDITTY
jgi:hypothetical protein